MRNVTIAISTVLLLAVTAPAAAVDTVGLQDPASGYWYLSDSANRVTQFFFGNPGDIPFLGDWDCNGTATPGLYRQSDGFAYVRNSNSQGVADVSFFMGDPSDIPLAGDFNGNGCDTVSVYRPGEQRIYISNTLGPNGGVLVADYSYVFGNPGDKPFVGDFNGNGSETIGLHRESNGFVYFRNTHDTGVANNEYFFGDPGDRLVAGDWGIVDGVDTPAVFRPSRLFFFFRHTNTQGFADSSKLFGAPQMLPVAGSVGDVADNATGVRREVPSAATTLVGLLNASRAGECGGLAALTDTPAVAKVAASHSVDMVANGFFSHVSPTTGGPFARLTAASIPFMAAGENIAIDSSLAGMHAAWMASPGHRANICSAAYGKIGIGVVADNDGSLTGTQVFTD